MEANSRKFILIEERIERLEDEEERTIEFELLNLSNVSKINESFTSNKKSSSLTIYVPTPVLSLPIQERTYYFIFCNNYSHSSVPN